MYLQINIRIYANGNKYVENSVDFKVSEVVRYICFNGIFNAQCVDTLQETRRCSAFFNVNDLRSPLEVNCVVVVL